MKSRPVLVRLAWMSFIIDWVIVIVFAVIAAVVSTITPNKRPFSIIDNGISFPFHDDTISDALLFVLSLLVPAIVTAGVALLATSTVYIFHKKSGTKEPLSLVAKRALKAWNRAWLGLALSFVLAFFICQSVKNLVGKPRPNLLARCKPNLNAALENTVGGYAESQDTLGGLQSWTICRNPDAKVIDEGFRSFPSGHSTLAFAGLTYLTLFLFSIFRHTTFHPTSSETPHPTTAATTQPTLDDLLSIAPRGLSFLGVVLAFVPVGVATYIGTTRFADFQHEGLDIICGSAIGIACAFFGWWWFAAPRRAIVRNAKLLGAGATVRVANASEVSHTEGDKSTDVQPGSNRSGDESIDRILGNRSDDLELGPVVTEPHGSR